MVENASWWVTITPAIVGFVGVVVGASITTATNYFLAVRKEKAEEALAARKEAAEAAKDKVIRANELKTAARLVWSEFVIVQVAANKLVERQPWVKHQFSLDAWNRHKEVLARELPRDVWIELEMMAEKFVDTFSQFPPDYCVDEITADEMRPFLERIKAGVEVIHQYM
jgi:hypothetical protein